MNTRTVLLWHNNGEERIYFTVNPARLTVTRPNENRVRSLAMGGTVNIWGGRGLREVRLTTFLPSAYSPFFDGKEPESVLAMLKSWQDSGDPVRLIISGSDINDAFLIEDVSETLAGAAGAAPPLSASGRMSGSRPRPTPSKRGTPFGTLPAAFTAMGRNGGASPPKTA